MPRPAVIPLHFSARSRRRGSNPEANFGLPSALGAPKSRFNSLETVR
jgi:hypothetical protein